jgi:hypothetical protein
LNGDWEVYGTLMRTDAGSGVADGVGIREAGGALAAAGA